jgi:RNA 3'-terminal phosphate cyclase (ATP)
LGVTGDILTIDGSHGEGGGQILRTSLALALITGKPFRLINIRAGRAKPGLMRQHLTCVTSAAQVGNAQVAGASVGSSVIEFRPGAVTPRRFSFVIGTAGSTSLVLQTVLPALLTAPGNSVVSVEGGTHNTKAPPFDFLERVFVPLLNRMGAKVTVRLERYGFFPAGGGRVVMEVEGVERLSPLELMERGEIKGRKATALVSQLPGHVAQRELDVVRDKLGWRPEHTQVRGTRESYSPGNALLVEVESEHVTEMCSAIGEVGKSAEAVAGEAVGEARAYLASGAPVGVHLADQLMLPLALARGGCYRTQALTLHSRTNIETIGRFLDVKIGVEEVVGGNVVVRVG